MLLFLQVNMDNHDNIVMSHVCIHKFHMLNYYLFYKDNYFFLNYYRLKDTAVKVAGSGRTAGFPQFFSKQYEYFHYIELCEHLKKDVCALKARGVGQH